MMAIIILVSHEENTIISIDSFGFVLIFIFVSPTDVILKTLKFTLK